jgi:hypothetical protein
LKKGAFREMAEEITWKVLVRAASSLLSVFDEAVNAYNTRDWATLSSLLDDYVLLKLPDKTKAPIYQKDAVLTYLKNDAESDNPNFNPQPNTIRPIVPHDVDNRFGYFTGLGYWEDNNGAGLIHYNFTFMNEGSIATPDWQLILLWGSDD